MEKKAKVDTAQADEPAEFDPSEVVPTKLKPIEIGDSLPAGLVLKNEKDEDFDVASVAEKKGVIMFLVPKANTSACVVPLPQNILMISIEL